MKYRGSVKYRGCNDTVHLTFRGRLSAKSLCHNISNVSSDGIETGIGLAYIN
jgi:hypothetical protein